MVMCEFSYIKRCRIGKYPSTLTKHKRKHISTHIYTESQCTNEWTLRNVNSIEFWFWFRCCLFFIFIVVFSRMKQVCDDDKWVMRTFLSVYSIRCVCILLYLITNGMNGKTFEEIFSILNANDTNENAPRRDLYSFLFSLWRCFSVEWWNKWRCFNTFELSRSFYWKNNEEKSVEMKLKWKSFLQNKIKEWKKKLMRNFDIHKMKLPNSHFNWKTL